MKLSEIKNLGIDLEVVRDAEVNSLGMATTRYKDKKVLSFLADAKFLQDVIGNKHIVAVICTPELLNNFELPERLGVVLSRTPRKDFFQLHNILVERGFYWEKFANDLSDKARISKEAVIAEHSVKIGANCLIEPGVVVFPGTIIGNDVIIRSGSQIGTSGFQFFNDGKNVFAVKTGGRVIIKDRVEIQHNSCIDRGVLGGDTVLEEDVKIDNFVHIAHDDYIGKRTFITAGVKLSGRITIGKDCWLGVNATVSNGLTIGDNCRISLGSVVTQNVEPNTTVTGNFAIEHDKFIQFIKSIR